MKNCAGNFTVLEEHFNVPKVNVVDDGDEEIADRFVLVICVW